MSRHFADRLAAGIRSKQTPLLVGLDPRWDSLPQCLLKDSGLLKDAGISGKPAAGKAAGQWSQIAAAYRAFCFGIIDVVAPLVAAVKPQAAFFEQIGPAGMVVLGEVIAYARSKGLIVILDGKRNDIGSTATGYAEGWIGTEESPWGADSLTVSPYLGDDSLRPFVDVAVARGGGIFVLVKTSNAGGGMFQDLVADSRAVYRHVADLVEKLSAETVGSCGYGIVGAVAGATYPEQLAHLRAEMPRTWLLIPGFGSQGGTAHDVAAGFDPHGLGAIVNSSRAIIFAHGSKQYRDKFADADWQRAVEAATLDSIAQLRADTPAGRL